MGNHNPEQKYYTISDLVQFTGLTDRTIRTYLSMGFLQGEKIGGKWRFTEEQADTFVRHPSVRPAILAKNNAVVYDFLMRSTTVTPCACMILDFPAGNERTLSEYFCRAITDGDLHDFHFTLNTRNKTTRVILKGRTQELIQLVNGAIEKFC